MNSDRETICDWPTCNATATNHLIFGFSATGREPAVANHGDLCREHIYLVNHKFPAVISCEIGMCPDQCASDEPLKVVTKAA